MIDVAKQWNPKQALLNEIIRRYDRFHEAIDLCLEMHRLVHTSEMSDCSFSTFEDQLWEGLEESTMRIMPTEKDVTIVWNLWHLSRIEDLVSNILIANDKQVIYQDNWLEKLEIDICNTGNVMTDDEIISFSNTINIMALRNYRIKVGQKTQEVIKNMGIEELKMKVKPERINRIYSEGGVVEGSKGLLDFWGKKDIAGLLLMPITRHQIVHLNDSFKLKRKLCGRK